jgi:hypothetical protein
MESIQILNTAIIKSKEKKIDRTYEARLQDLCKSPALKAINKAISQLSEEEKISRDQASLMVVETLRELDSIWNDYVIMEGLDRLKTLLKQTNLN